MMGIMWIARMHKVIPAPAVEIKSQLTIPAAKAVKARNTHKLGRSIGTPTLCIAMALRESFILVFFVVTIF